VPNDNAKATFAAGCFWGVQKHFDSMTGVLKTAVGYTGGHVDKPSYEQVCSGTTGHVEAIEIIFDPEKITYAVLLNEFFKIHDPTTLNRQGPDIGSQYRSAIFTHTKEQQQCALSAIASHPQHDCVVTQVVPANEFHPAEEYHQKYIEKKS
jgi:peptide-methionine (S)-S-oxide reductase